MQKLLLYPNPAYDALTVALPEVPAITLQLRLFDLNGRMAQQQVAAEHLVQINLSGIPEGVSICQMCCRVYRYFRYPAICRLQFKFNIL
jgi:Secretion system C-terminal sorting domain